MNKLKKVLLIIAIFSIGIFTSTIVKAEKPVETFTVCDKEEGVINHPVHGNHFFPHDISGNTVFCVQWRGSYNATLSREQFNAYKVGSTIPTTGFQCVVCGGGLGDRPWSGTLKYLKYTRGEKLKAYEHQDEAYNLANAIEDPDKNLESWDTAFATWASSVSDPRQNFDEANEGNTYDLFYKKIHINNKDIYETLLKDKTTKSKVKVGVKVGEPKKSGTYTVGPFSVSYPSGQYEGKNKFSWISSIEAVTNSGTYTGDKVKILSDTGKEITGLGQDGTNTLNGKEFYISFESTEATKVSVKINFGYLESCSAEMWEYNGKAIGRKWEYDTIDDFCEHTEQVACSNPNCTNTTPNHTHPQTVKKAGEQYILKEEELGDTQNLMALIGGLATKNYDKKSITLVPTGIDLTMKIAGNVFLDKEKGKVNTGNNRFDTGEALPGVEVILYDEKGNMVTVTYDVTHEHEGSSSEGTGCYTKPVYHKHDGSKNSYGKCYTQASHTHIGSSSNGGKGTCFKTPVYHEHFDKCYNSKGKVTCGMTTKTIIYYEKTCDEKITYKKKCGKTEETVEYYKANCGKTESTITGTQTQKCTMLTDSKGHYEFAHLNAMKKYYVKFIYNGMLYTNVVRLEGNANDISKATELAQGNPNNRQTFNNVFAEIGSYPNNYKTKDCITGADIYNRTYLQEEIADLFKEVSAAIVEQNGDEKAGYQAIINRHSTDGEIRQKVQYIADNRISAYTTEKYPLTKIFTIDNTWNEIAGKNYDPIYLGQYNQLHVNLGIKARPIFDLALYKDVFNAVLEINGKSETYTYNLMEDWQNEGFSLGVDEDYYISQLREKYIRANYNTNITTKELVNSGEYSHELRTEEVVNGNNSNTNINESKLFNEDKTYSWREINHGITENDKLKIHITYKIAIRNQSGIVGAVTEIVDYYDNNYNFERAYVGDKNGNELPGTSVDVGNTSKYGAATQYGTNGKYNTIYLRPTEQRLYNDSKEQYVYVTFGLINPEQTLIDAKLPDGEKLYTYNLAEINGYKTYTSTNYNDSTTIGLVDKDSNPGNFNPSTYVRGTTKLEDDENQAPAYVYSIRNSRTIEGNVFEDAITSMRDPTKLIANQSRYANGSLLDRDDKRIKDIKVELLEIKQNGNDKKLIVRATTWTDQNGWYGFGAFLPGDYVIRFTYGLTDGTAMTTTSEYRTGSNDTSYNGQDYQATTYQTKQGETITPQNYQADDTLRNIYNSNNSRKNAQESALTLDVQNIKKYENSNYYWYNDTSLQGKSDAYEDNSRRNQINAYAKTEYGREITNHKAEVFNSYINQSKLRDGLSKGQIDKFTNAQAIPEKINTKEYNSALVDELERRTYQYSYTAEIPVEVEYTTKSIEGNQGTDKYTYKITGVDFGVVERPRLQLTIDQDIAHIKVTAADGNILFDTSTGTNNLMWTKKGDISKYDKGELINIILDDELLNGAKLEITYSLTVTNNSEKDLDATRAKTIINYVSNNLNFDAADNNGLWEIVKKDDIQNDKYSTYINNAKVGNENIVDLSTQTTILKASSTNPLVNKKLKPTESVNTTLVLKKTLSAEHQDDDLDYTNMTEIVEVENTVGRYDHGAIPGNQSLDVNPREHDTSGASRYVDEEKNTYPDDGRIIVTPPTGSKYIYYGIAILATVILAAGIFVIKKFVIDKRK